jgi:hypothetical protein
MVGRIVETHTPQKEYPTTDAATYLQNIIKGDILVVFGYE